MFTNYEEVGHGASAGQPDNITDMIAVDMGVVADDLKTDDTRYPSAPRILPAPLTTR